MGKCRGVQDHRPSSEPRGETGGAQKTRSRFGRRRHNHNPTPRITLSVGHVLPHLEASCRSRGPESTMCGGRGKGGFRLQATMAAPKRWFCNAESAWIKVGSRQSTSRAGRLFVWPKLVINGALLATLAPPQQLPCNTVNPKTLSFWMDFAQYSSLQTSCLGLCY